MKRILSIMIALSVLCPAFCVHASNTLSVTEDFMKYTNTFSDLEGYEWAREPIEYLTSEGIVSGMGEGVFAPYRKITRSEFVKLVCTACALNNPSARSEFTDVGEDAWYYSYVSSAYEAGLLEIYTDGVFEPDMPISREDMCYIAYEALKFTGTLPQIKAETAFADDGEIALYAKEAVYALKSLGVISGKDEGRFDPKGESLRAESAKILYNLLKIFTENYNK